MLHVWRHVGVELLLVVWRSWPGPAHHALMLRLEVRRHVGVVGRTAGVVHGRLDAAVGWAVRVEHLLVGVHGIELVHRRAVMMLLLHHVLLVVHARRHQAVGIHVWWGALERLLLLWLLLRILGLATVT